MQYDMANDSESLVVFGHMCSIRIEADLLKDLFEYLSIYPLRYSLAATRIGKFFFVSMYFNTKELAKKMYTILLDWNP